MGAFGYFRKDEVGVTDRGSIAAGFCDIFTKVGLRLAARVRRERGAFLEYLGDILANFCGYLIL